MSSAQITQHFQVRKTERDAGAKPKRPDASSTSQGKAAGASSSTSPETRKDFEMLRQFDLNWEYGPCMGVTRLERWNRAEKYGLKPPAALRDLLMQNSEDERYTQSLWNDYKTLN